MNKILCFSLCLLYAACMPSKEPSVEGTYNLVYAERNHNATGSMEGAYIQFISKNEMETNILGDTIRCPFRYENDLLYQESDPALTYKVKTNANDSLVLEMKINKLPFFLVFKK